MALYLLSCGVLASMQLTSAFVFFTCGARAGEAVPAVSSAPMTAAAATAARRVEREFIVPPVVAPFVERSQFPANTRPSVGCPHASDGADRDARPGRGLHDRARLV